MVLNNNNNKISSEPRAMTALWQLFCSR